MVFILRFSFSFVQATLRRVCLGNWACGKFRPIFFWHRNLDHEFYSAFDPLGGRSTKATNMSSDLPQPSGLSDQQISDLTAAFYRRVREDDLIGPMYPDNDWSGAEQRLRDFDPVSVPFPTQAFYKESTRPQAPPKSCG